MTEVILPDGSKKEFEGEINALDVAKSISHGLAKNVLAAKVNGTVWEATRTLPSGCKLELLTWDSPLAKSTFWHSSAHLMAEALESLYPGIKLGIGPPIANGFYYDVDPGDRVISQDDFEKIEKKMLELASQKNAYIRKEVPKDEAIAYFKQKDDPYKLELIEDLPDGEITFYTQGAFTDLCRGPHLTDTGKIKAIKLLNVAGAYWRGDVERKQLTRIYGVSFPKQKELDEYLHMLEEAKKRDHRKLGKELELFHFSERVGLGLPIWLPKGATLRDILVNFLKKVQTEAGYQPIVSPHIGSKELYVTSGHYAKYGQDSFKPILTPEEDQEFLLKPMNCPHHCEAYKVRPRSYRELPMRYAEFGTVYRFEQSGELHGLTRVRGFTQDDAHIFCRPDQVKDEFKAVIDLVLYVFGVFGFNDYVAQISLRDPENPDKYIGNPANWDLAEAAIAEAAKEKGLNTVTETGEAAFYGPKLDFMVKDAIGRSWQLGTIQVDYNLPERFELEYIGEDSQKHRPVMIHRAPFGSLERFISILIENCSGNFPVWLAPVQVSILPISDRFIPNADEVVATLKLNGFRVESDYRAEKIGRKIRDAEVQKVPYMVILGEKEIEAGTLSVRKHGQGDKGSMPIADFMNMLNQEINQSIQ